MNRFNQNDYSNINEYIEMKSFSTPLVYLIAFIKNNMKKNMVPWLQTYCRCISKKYNNKYNYLELILIGNFPKVKSLKSWNFWTETSFNCYYHINWMWRYRLKYVVISPNKAIFIQINKRSQMDRCKPFQELYVIYLFFITFTDILCCKACTNQFAYGEW